jgi:lipoprotein-anchoring transpeptidase ErfK/SrfK
VRRRRSVAPAVWLAAAVAIAALGWLWWRTSKPWQPAANNQTQLLPATNVAQPPPGGVVNVVTSPVSPAGPLTSGKESSRVANSNPAASSGAVAADKNVRAPEADFPRAVQNVFEMQVALARRGLSCGSIDGLIGPQTRAALETLQQQEHLEVSGQLDNATRACLLLKEAPTTEYQVTSNDLARLQPLSPTWLGKSKQTALEYETVLELVAEKAQANPALIRRLNPDLDWAGVAPGTTIEIPKVGYPAPARRAGFVTIRLGAKILEAWDLNTNLLAHFPCSIARQMEKRLVGELHVEVIAYNPNYTFDPENFPESAEARELGTKLVLPPGPNNPVGTAWIGLDKPGYGIHGTPRPEQVGRTESHGCFRLANWNAEYLARLVAIGTPVYVEP